MCHFCVKLKIFISFFTRCFQSFMYSSQEKVRGYAAEVYAIVLTSAAPRQLLATKLEELVKNLNHKVSWSNTKADKLVLFRKINEKSITFAIKLIVLLLPLIIVMINYNDYLCWNNENIWNKWKIKRCGNSEKYISE